LGVLEHNKGIWHLEMREFKSAKEAFERAAAALEPLRRDYRRTTEYREHLALVRKGLAEAYRQTKDNEKAEAAFKAALDLRRELDRDHGGAPQHRDALAEAYNEVGSFYADTRQAKKAEEAYGNALQFREELVAKYPDVTAFATGLGGVCCNLGHVASGEERSEKAREWYDMSIRALAKPAQDPKNTQARTFLGNAHAGRAGIFLKLNRPKDAVADLDRVLELRTGPGVYQVRFLRAVTLLKLKDHARVAADAAVLARPHPIPKNTLYALAALYALANEAAQQDDALTPEAKGEFSEQYAAESIKLLRRAHAAGMFQPPTVRANVRRNRDLRSLHGRADFKAFLDELERGAQ
jgi:tetratricopeptide (TPR) repeat protein